MLTNETVRFYDNPMMDGRQGSDWGTVMILFWAALLILLIVGVVLLLKINANSNNADEAPKPLDIAKKRYAKGEIKKAEFEQIKKDLA